MRRGSSVERGSCCLQRAQCFCVALATTCSNASSAVDAAATIDAMHLVIACAAELAQFVLATPPLSCAVIVRVCWLYEFHLRAERAIETRSLAAFVLRVAWALLLLPIVGTTCARWYGASAWACLLYTSPSPRDQRGSRMPSSA